MMIAFIVFWTTAWPLLAVPPETPPDPYAVIDQVNQSAAGALWPGFGPPRIPVALFTGSQTLLFCHPRPPAGFLPVSRPARSHSIPRPARIDGGQHIP